MVISLASRKGCTLRAQLRVAGEELHCPPPPNKKIPPSLTKKKERIILIHHRSIEIQVYNVKSLLLYTHQCLKTILKFKLKQCYSYTLTCPTKFVVVMSSCWPLFFLPVTISRSKIPKLYTSDFIENCPSIAYSGDI